jgi:hypothetical protein
VCWRTFSILPAHGLLLLDSASLPALSVRARSQAELTHAALVYTVS